jgi:heat shock protein HslJ
MSIRKPGKSARQFRLHFLFLVLLAGTAVFYPVASAPAEDSPGGASSSSLPQIITADATVVYVDLEGGFYGIIAADGSRYVPKTLAKRFSSDGQAVIVKMVPSRNQSDIQMWGVPVTIISIRERTTTVPAGTAPLVVFERTGGFAGVSDRMSVYPNATVLLEQKGRSDRFTLEPGLMEDLRSALEKSGFKRLRNRYLSTRPVADTFRYSITYGGKTILTEDTAVPRQLEPVIELLGIIMNTPNGSSGQGTQDLSGTYVLQSMMSEKGLMIPVINGTAVSLSISSDGITGKAGCNQYGGTVTLGPDGAVVFGPIYSTEMYCTGSAVMAQESRYLGLLEKTTRFVTGDGQISGYDVSGYQTLKFTRTGDGIKPVLEGISGTVWNVDSVRGRAGKMVTPVAGSEITLLIEENGTVSGRAGCNLYGGALTIRKDGTVSLSPLVSTLMYCSSPEGVMDQESLYLGTFGKTTRLSVENGLLTAFGQDGATLVTFTRQLDSRVFTFRGTVRYVDIEGGFHGIVGNDGTQYQPVNLGSEWKKDGLQVSVTARPGEDGMSIYMWGQQIEIITIARA